jgi:hypothetical protein
MENLFNRRPPGLEPSPIYQGIGLDATNSILRGRFIVAQITKRW